MALQLINKNAHQYSVTVEYYYYFNCSAIYWRFSVGSYKLLQLKITECLEVRLLEVRSELYAF